MATQRAEHRNTKSEEAAHSAPALSKPDAAAEVVKVAGTNNAGTLMIAATAASLVVFILSAYALQNIYRWYPQLVAQRWFIYDQLLTIFSLLELISGALASSLIVSKRSFTVAVASATICTLSGASAFVLTLIQPLAILWVSLVFYFLPLFVIPLTGTVLTYLEADKTTERTC